jgi:hypothetical protein
MFHVSLVYILREQILRTEVNSSFVPTNQLTSCHGRRNRLLESLHKDVNTTLT